MKARISSAASDSRDAACGNLPEICSTTLACCDLAGWCTRSGFEQWLCLQDPSSEEANVTITYITEDGETPQQKLTLRANSCMTVDVRLSVGAGWDVSCKVASDIPIVAERPMYLNYHGWCTGGHDVMGDVR